MNPPKRTHLLLSPRLSWWLPELRAVVAARNQTVHGCLPCPRLHEGFGEFLPPSGSPVGGFQPQRIRTLAFLFPLSSVRIEARFPSWPQMELGPQLRGCPLTSRSQSPSSPSRGSPEPAEPMPAARRHGLGSPAPLRSQISGSLAPTDFAQQLLRFARAPGMARSQAAA